MEPRHWTDDRLDDFPAAVRVNEELSALCQWARRLTIGTSLGFISVLATILARGV